MTRDRSQRPSQRPAHNDPLTTTCSQRPAHNDPRPALALLLPCSLAAYFLTRCIGLTERPCCLSGTLTRWSALGESSFTASCTYWRRSTRYSRRHCRPSRRSSTRECRTGGSSRFCTRPCSDELAALISLTSRLRERSWLTSVWLRGLAAALSSSRCLLERRTPGSS